MNDKNFKKTKKDLCGLSREEVECLMDKELQKDESEIDTDFVDECVNFLLEGVEVPAPSDKILENVIKANSKQTLKNKTNSTKAVKILRVLAAAAALAALLAASLTVYAGVNETFRDKFVKFFDGYAAINYEEKETETPVLAGERSEAPLYKELEKGGIENIMLPEELYTIKHEKLNWQSDGIEKYVTFISGNKKISVTIQSFCDAKYVTSPDLQGDFTNTRKIDVNGADVYLFETGGKDTIISYQIGLTQYLIQYPGNIADAEEFMKTAK